MGALLRTDDADEGYGQPGWGRKMRAKRKLIRLGQLSDALLREMPDLLSASKCTPKE